MTEKIEIEKFKDLFLDMYRGFPNYIYTAEEVKKIIKPAALLVLRSEKYLILLTDNMDEKKTKYYMLGPNALSLISAWKNERTSNRIEKLTNVLTLFTIMLFGAGIYPFFKDVNPSANPNTNILFSFASAALIMIVVRILFNKNCDI